MKKLISLVLSVLMLLSLLPAVFAEEAADGEVFSNDLFSLTIPSEFAGTYEVEVREKEISVYHKASREANCGGFAFGVYVSDDPAQYAYMPGGRKVGEMTSGDGTLYNVFLDHPTDVQYDFSSEEATEAYRKLYGADEDIVKGMKSTDGGVFVYGAGTKGEDLYTEVLAKYVQAVTEEWDSSRLEEEEMSPVYYAIRMSSDGNPLERIGFAYHDVNGDGIEELLVGEIAEGAWKGVIYDVYTMMNREPVHVISGWERNRYFAYEYSFLCNEWSGGAALSGWTLYDLLPNTTELFPQMAFKYDGYENPDQPWFIAYGIDIENDVWENVTEEKFNERKATFEDYLRFDYTPLSTLA